MQCPVCGNEAVAELCDPAGVALCLSCGQLLQRFQTRLHQVFNTSPENVKLATAFEELGIDSLDLVELVLELKEEFGVMIPEEEVGRMITVEDVLSFLHSEMEREGE